MFSRNISNSEVTAWLSCKVSYYFGYFRNLTPKVTPMPLARGTLGHSAFEEYAHGRLAGMSHEDALRGSMGVFNVAAAEGNIDVDVILETKMLYQRYMEHHKGWQHEWEILGSEERSDLKITNQITTTMRYDLLVREKKTNRVFLVDYKFTYDFWRPDDHDLNGQMSKYITILNNNGIHVDGGILEEIRTRKLKNPSPNDLWRRTYYFPSNEKKRMMMKQHIVASSEIIEFHEMTQEEREMKMIPVLNKHGACKYCNFIDVCNTRNNGQNYELMLQTNFVENSYGYNNSNTTERIEGI